MRIIRGIDTETCGIDEPNLQIVEIATLDLVDVSSDPNEPRWQRGERWSTLVNPGRPIPPEASAIHHITDDMVTNAPMISDLAGLLPPEAPQAWCAHNSRFDVKVLKANGIVLDEPMLDTYRGALSAWPDAPNHKNQTLRYWLGLKLADAALAQPHRAAGDVYVTMAIARRLLAAGNTVETWAQVSARPALLPRLTFGEHAMKPIDQVPMSYWDWILHKAKGSWDEDVLYTARHHYESKREASRSRSPV